MLNARSVMETSIKDRMLAAKEKVCKANESFVSEEKCISIR